MAGTFTERIEVLRAMTGMPGELTGTVTVDQVYAHYQHERADLHHPRGGGPFYLRTPLFLHFRSYLQAYASAVLRDGGHASMITSMEHLSDELHVYAPILFNNLRRSGHPQVWQGGVMLYDRQPEVHRLTKAQLQAEDRLLWPSLPGALKGWIYWHFNPRGRAGHPPAGSGWGAWWKRRGR